MRLARLLLVLAAFFVPLVAANAQESPVAMCDRLAGDPGVALAAVDPELARLACEAAIQVAPGEQRLLHQYARTLEASGDLDAARRLYEWLAGDGYAPAQFALGRLIAADEAGSTEAEALMAEARAQGYDPETSPSATEPGASAQDGLLAWVDMIGRDPAALLAFVSDEIAPEGYAGAMRGSYGTLSARSGSAADKALLLADLLRLADSAAELRFASCTLDPNQAATLLNAVRTTRPTRPQPLLEAAVTFAPQIENPEVRPIAEGLAGIWTEATDTVRAQADIITNGFANAALSRPPEPISEADLIAALSTHYWVQRRDGADWTDLDPTLANANPGQSLCSAETTFDALPDAAQHHVEINIVLEERTESGLSERTLLTKTLPIPSLVSGGLTFAIAESVGLGTLVPEQAPPDGFFYYTPLLHWDGTNQLAESFLMPKPISALRDGGFGDLGGSLGELGDVFGSDPPANATDAPRPDNPVAGLWLHLATIAPDGARQDISAPIFDRLGLAHRESGEPFAEPLPDLVEIDGDYVDLSSAWDISVLDGRWGGIGGTQDITEGDGYATLFSGLRAVHGVYDLTRQSLYEAVAGPDAPRFVRMQPGLSLLGWLPSADPENLTGATYLMDVVAEGGRPLEALSENDPALAIRAASTVVAERLTVNFDRLVLPLFGTSDVPPYAPLDVPALFEAAAAQNIGVVMLESAAGALPKKLASPEAILRIEAHLAAGSMLLMPERPVRIGDASLLGWYFRDPETGLFRDQLENGRHAELGEYNATNEPPRQAAPATRSFGQRLACTLNRARVVLGIAAALSGEPGGEQAALDGLKFEQAIVEAAEKNRRAGQSVADPPGSCGAGG